MLYLDAGDRSSRLLPSAIANEEPARNDAEEGDYTPAYDLGCKPTGFNT